MTEHRVTRSPLEHLSPGFPNQLLSRSKVEKARASLALVDTDRMRVGEGHRADSPAVPGKTPPAQRRGQRHPEGLPLERKPANSAVKSGLNLLCKFHLLKRFALSREAHVQSARVRRTKCQGGCRAQTFPAPDSGSQGVGLAGRAVVGCPRPRRQRLPFGAPASLSGLHPRPAGPRTRELSTVGRPPRRSPQTARGLTPALGLRLQGPFYPRDTS